MKSNLFNIHEIILIITIVELFFLVILCRMLPRHQIQSMKILSYFFVLVIGVLISTLIIWNPELQHWGIANSIFPILILCTCLLLQGPVLYLYLKSLNQSIQFWSRDHLAHLVPALICVLVIVVWHVDVFDWIPTSWPLLSAVDLRAVKFVWFMLKCFPLLYVLVCFYWEYQLRIRHKNELSNLNQNDLRFADIVLAGFFIHWFWSFLAYFIGGYIDADTNDLLGIINNYLTVILVNVLFAFGLLNTRELLSQVDSGSRSKTDVIELDEDKISVVVSGMQERKLYLDGHLNLERFSAQIGLKPKEVSAIINQQFHTNFFEFINGYRVEEAKRLLTDEQCKQITVIDVVYQSGFNSQSAFHRFFKRMVGVSPTEYRNQFSKKKSQSL